MDMEKEEYAQTFADEVAIENGDITEDDAAQGLVPDELEGAAPVDATDQTVAVAPADPAATDGPAAAQTGDTGAGMDKETQRLKSWEGRLKAREAELKAREAELGAGANASGSESAGGDPAQAVEMAADALASGEPLSDAMAAIEADFGPEFVQALSALISAQASRVVEDKVGDVNADVASLIETLKSDKQRDHFEFIAERHPDFMEMAASPEFQDWTAQQGEAAEKIVGAGSARQVCALLDAFKQGASKAAAADPSAGAAVAVPSRSGGLRLPAKPASSDDYMSAWDEA